jgi:DNA-binding MarR family transcriptional regulator
MDLRQLARAVDQFAVLDPTHLPAHFIQVFLAVASDGPCTFRVIEDRLSLSNSAVSRTINALGATNRKGHPGFDLVTVERDPQEGRRFLVMLTAKGKALKRQLEAI